MEPLTIILTIIGLLLAIFAVYVGIKQLIKWRREPGEIDEKIEGLREEVRKGFEEARRDNPQMTLYADGLAEMPDSRRLSLLNQGLAAMREYRFPEAIEFFRECLGQGVTTSQRIALLLLTGSDFFTTGQLEVALGHYSEAAALARESNDKQGLSAAIGNMGLVYQIKGESDQALEHYRQALDIHREIGHRSGEASDLGNIANVYLIKGELDKALEHHQQALNTAREISDRQVEANELGNVGSVYLIKGETDKALEHHQQALRIDREIGHRHGEASDLGNIGSIYLTKGETDTALDYYQQALKIFEEVGAKAEAAMAREEILKLKEGDQVG